MKPATRNKIRVLAILAPIIAIAPIALGLEGAWIALHLIGGATALAILIYCCWQLSGTLRWFALAGVAISITTISVITGGGTLGPVVQIAMLVVLGSIYFVAVSHATRTQSSELRSRLTE